MLVQVKYNEQQKYVKLNCTEGRFDLMQFHLKVMERFCLPPDANVTYKDATGTEIDAEIFSDLTGQSNMLLTVFSNDDFLDSLPTISEKSDTSNSSSVSTVISEEVPNKGQKKRTHLHYLWIKTLLSCLTLIHRPGCFRSGTCSSGQMSLKRPNNLLSKANLRSGNGIPPFTGTSPSTTTRTEVSKHQCM